MNRIRRKSGKADCHVFRSVGTRRAVPHPFSGVRYYALPCEDLQCASFVLDPQHSLEYDRDLLEFRALPGLFPAWRRNHACDADCGVPGVYPAGKLLDPFWLCASGFDYRRCCDQFRHANSPRGGDAGNSIGNYAGMSRAGSRPDRARRAAGPIRFPPVTCGNSCAVTMTRFPGVRFRCYLITI